ncbi:hypothetical protein H5410_053539 [Solanum commersonii]|uniref:Uncharacterized protein n=1 Tax=Solanum commersonii TaxID=4109 RepID=A0A9J5X7G1_SOLCO|nr:hypothetical protein H5410_053539 [Solanum commersonii]
MELEIEKVGKSWICCARRWALSSFKTDPPRPPYLCFHLPSLSSPKPNIFLSKSSFYKLTKYILIHRNETCYNNNIFSVISFMGFEEGGVYAMILMVPMERLFPMDHQLKNSIYKRKKLILEINLPNQIEVKLSFQTQNHKLKQKIKLQKQREGGLRNFEKENGEGGERRWGVFREESGGK